MEREKLREDEKVKGVSISSIRSSRCERKVDEYDKEFASCEKTKSLKVKLVPEPLPLVTMFPLP